MAKSKPRWREGTIIAKTLADGLTYYARLLEFPWVAFYRHRTEADSDAPESITTSPLLFTLAAHKTLLTQGGWRTIAERPLEPGLGRPSAQAIWDDDGTCHIMDANDEMHPATPEQCEGLEPAAVWEPEHIADRLQDAFDGRENRWLRELRPR